MKQLVKKRKECYFCVHQIGNIDYKDMFTLKQYISSYGKIKPRKYTGNCAKHQRALGTSIKRSRFMALIPYVMR